MQRIEQKVQQNRSQQVRNTNSVFSKIKNRITHTYQNQKQIIQQIDQSTTKNDQPPSSQTLILMQTPKMSHKRTQSKDLSKKLKLKDYIRLNQISREKRSQSFSINKLITNKSLTSVTNFNPLTTFNPYKQLQKEQQPKKVEKRPLKPYQKQIQLEKGQLLLTTQKAREKFQKIMNLIEETNDKMSGYNDLVFMFNIEEMMNNYILKGMEQIRQAYSQHFAEMNEDNIVISTIKIIQNISPSKSKKERTSMSPAARAQFKALEEIYLLGGSNIKKKLPVSYDRSVTQFNENQSESQQLNRTNPEIRKRQRS